MVSTGVSGERAIVAMLELGFTDVVIIRDSERARLFDAAVDEPALQVISPT